jgi:hypothetical protein
MGQALSMDLRPVLLAAMDGEMSVRKAAARCGIAPSTVIRRRTQRRDSGDFGAKPHGGELYSRRVS